MPFGSPFPLIPIAIGENGDKDRRRQGETATRLQLA